MLGVLAGSAVGELVGVSRLLGAEPRRAAVTIASMDAEDDPAMNCNRRFIAALPNRYTVDAVSNYLSCVSFGMMLGRQYGHGASGVIATGCGPYLCGTDRYVSDYNDYHWKPLFSLLKDRMERFELWACHPGADESGADLLYTLAVTLNCPVAGSNGLLYCDTRRGLYFESGSVWVEATPQKRPTPVKPVGTFLLAESFDGGDRMLNGCRN
jgi:hypothetical protein